MARIGTDLEFAKKLLEEGKLVAIPTETVYGLAGNAFDPEAVALIFETKNRPSFDPLIVHVDSINRLKECTTDFPEGAKKLADKFWPGPLTLLLPKSTAIPDIVTAGMPEVAIRIPDNQLTMQLLESLDFPLVAPSANPFGYISPTTAKHVDDQLGAKVLYILDGGACRVGLESTIVGFPHGTPTIYRLGGLSIEQIEEVAGPVKVLPHSTSNPKAPGMLKSHYAPSKPFTLCESNDPRLMEHAENTGYIFYSKASREFPLEHVRILAPDGNTHTAAKNLFGAMRELDNMNVSRIIAEKAPDEGLGKAINDRLKRAAAG